MHTGLVGPSGATQNDLGRFSMGFPLPQDMQNDLDRESSSLQELESQKQDAQERLEEMDQQRSKLEGMLNDIKQKCQEESQMVSKPVPIIHPSTFVLSCTLLTMGVIL